MSLSILPLLKPRIGPSQPWPDPPEEQSKREIELGGMRRRTLRNGAIWPNKWLGILPLVIYILWYYFA